MSTADTSAPTYEQIRYETSDGIATITLNRPANHNAYTTQMMSELIDAFDRVDADDNVRAVVFTGEGRMFCAGADLELGAKTFNQAGTEGSPIKADGSIDYAMDSARDFGGRLTLRMYECLKPIIGAVNGPAVGIGATMLLPMDVRIASEKARFGFVFARRGIVPEGASSWFLPRIVGVSRALEWCMSGRIFQATEALEGGLVTKVTPPEELMSAAYAVAHEIADNAAPVSVALTRQMMWRGLGMQHPMEAHRVDSRGILARGRSKDASEGVMSFLEKRPAKFTETVSKDMPDYFPWWESPEYR